MGETSVLIRGAGDIASGIAHRLFRCGFSVYMTEIPAPTSIRRKVAFSEAVYDGEAEVEGVKAVLARSVEDAINLSRNGLIPVLVDPDLKCLEGLKPVVLVDSILAKKNLGTRKSMAPVVIGVGPGFTAGEDCHAVVESLRGHDLGRVIMKGRAAENTGIPGEVMNYTLERVIYAPAAGRIRLVRDIGSPVNEGELIAMIGNVEVRTKIGGVLRGIIRNGFEVWKGMKIGDVDPRGIVEHCYTISDKARAIAGGVLEAALYLLNHRMFS
ncbi:selenium-dependent molybdenum cofactor biosynthesis protein YqeB [Thermosediminibacter litoriperuensis]|uniref:Xanthine dehydrogenase accessory factor n=1 Tax=Thermosediminibacter litoriperuensis TaxID=291989 RepID=A0A5S5AL71_9FIRM|nr:selenium-dependent molybdenum cofactor biosynthesis protein YqeB [Thermosediminibacter litoriperuensis]TYP51594.1 xanthine dehydrogenase accessory factor [Thermosediminibacter litoriperuensis]